MRGSRVEPAGRGRVRGLFLFAAMAVGACDKPEPPPAPEVVEDVGPKEVADTGSTADVPVEVVPPAEFDPPWTALAPPWSEVSATIASTSIGKVSGQAWGTDSPVHGIVRASCGNGTLLQVIYKTGAGLRVTPAMPVRFFGLPTSGETVAYSEGGFDVKSTFTHDTPERLAGRFVVTYDEHGQEKTFMDLTVDGKPMTTLYEPRLDGEANVPEFQSCHPSGRFIAETADGRTAQGFMNGVLSPDGKGMAITALLSDRSGLRIVIYSDEALDEPWTMDLSKSTTGGPVRVVVEALYTPELTAPTEAKAQNLGTLQTTGVREGTVTMTWDRKGKKSDVVLRFTNLRVPELIGGPLRGATFTHFVIEAAGTPPDAYPDPPPAEPLTLSDAKD